jgi:asparagine synthase (glutamine-hydrolysing)
MCGIAGIYFGDGRPVDPAVLQRMGDALAHRGPDSQGSYVEPGRPSVGLMSRRLAVIDIEGGTQPMTIADGAYTIIYSGELFNTPELRTELEARGHRFSTRCDTEVVVRGYAEWGQAVLERMLGMWAFCIWDRDRRSLFLARDRLGVKPLVYAPLDGGVMFASEIKALVSSGLIERRLNSEALPHYLSAFAVPEPYTLVRGARRLRSGHALTVCADGVSEVCYWDCAIAEEPDRGRAAYREEVAELLDDAVLRQLVSDVPLGVFLSGGVDSSLIAAAAVRADPATKTFTAGFGDPSADERPAARAIANQLGTDHHETVIQAGDAAAALPRLLRAYDEPGQSLLQTHFISRFARESVTVALSGLGGDELFSSYPTHIAVNLLSRLDRAPRFARGLVQDLARVVPSRRLRRLAQLSAMEPDDRAARELFHQTTAALRTELLCADARAELDLEGPVRHLSEHFERAQSRHPLNRLLYVYLKTYVPDELLRATDAMGMLHSLELRVPLLDHRLVEHAMRMPARHKMRFAEGKLILRDIAGRRLEGPPGGGKRGFSPPVAAWLRGEWAEEIRDTLAATTLSRRGIFDPAAVQRLVRRCLQGDERLAPAVMMLYCFETWAQSWLDGDGIVPGAARAVEIAPVRTPVEPRAPGRDPELSVIVTSWNTRELTRSCLRSLERHLRYVSHEVIVVDNASGDGSAEMITADFPGVRLLRNPENAGFAVANNQAMKVARGAWFLLLNSDTELIDCSVARLFERVRSEADVGVAHCRLRFPDGRLQHTVYRFPSIALALLEDLGFHKLAPRFAPHVLLGGYWDYGEERDVDWVAGAFMLLPRQVFEATGGFDERLFMYGEDMEWCYRIRDHGWKVRYYPSASIMHVDHASSELRWGDARVALCLQRQLDIFTERHGRWRGRALMAVRLTGAGLRTVYYSWRARLSGPGARPYREMEPHVRATFRALAALAFGRG